MWRVWIEIILSRLGYIRFTESPSVWRVWIEIPPYAQILPQVRSPSVWRVWIEMRSRKYRCTRFNVTLRVEGVD